MFWNMDRASILCGVGLSLPSHLLEQLGLTVLCVHGFGGTGGKYQDVFLFSFSVSVFYKVNDIKICFYYRCMLQFLYCWGQDQKISGDRWSRLKV